MEHKEIWKPIKGYDIEYLISDCGNIISPEHTIIDKRGVKQHFRKREVKPVLHNTGYLVVTFRKQGKKVTIRIHRLIAELFVENPDNKPIIDHIDGDKTNNNAKNLRWVTNSENIRNENTYNNFKEKVTKIRKSEIKPVYQLDDNYNVIAKFNSAEEAAKAMSCSASLIRNCCKIRHYKAKSFHWSYSPFNIKLKI
jgi:hypothetical protein